MLVLMSGCGRLAGRPATDGVGSVALPAGGIEVVSLADRHQVISPPVDYVFAGPSPVAPAPTARAWWAPVQIPDLQRFSAIARVLGLSGPPSKAAADRCAYIDPTTTALRPSCTYDGPWVMYGDSGANGSSATLSLDPGGNWFYSPSGSSPGGVGCVGIQDPLPNLAGGVTTFPVRAPSPDDAPCPARDESGARADAEHLMSKLGMTTSDYIVSTRTDRNGVSVVADRVLGAVRSGVKFVVGFSSDGSVRFASGSLLRLQAAGELPIVSPEVALRRLNDHSGRWQFPRTALDGSALAGFDGFPAPVVLTLTGTPADEAAYTTIAGSAAVTFVGVQLGLLAVASNDGSTWLLPAYDFATADGQHQRVVAVEEASFMRPPTAPTVPSTTVPPIAVGNP
jgi:hypothetical protein